MKICGPVSGGTLQQSRACQSFGTSLTRVMVRLQVGADVAALSANLTKPLRPLWVSQQSRLWTDDVVPAEDLPFTPLILVSASLPNARQRMSTGDRSTNLGPDNLIH